MRILSLVALFVTVKGQAHRLCIDSRCDSTCYREFSKYDANAFLSSGKRSTPRECCHESYCEDQGIKCKTEQYRSYIARKYFCPAGKVVAVTSWCPGHYSHTCTDFCQALGRDRCENGGTCVPAGASYTCTCRAGFEGQICQVNIDECSPNPCNISTSFGCTDGVNDYTCNCKPGYRGKTCNIDIDECASSPCQNGATCVDYVNRYTCKCAPGYTGTFCEIDIDECASTPCQNGATCHDKVNRFTCECPPRIYGVLCDTNICHPTPADVVFVLDSSISMTQEDFQKQLDFVANFSGRVPIGPRDFQISVVTFSSEAHLEFYLNQFSDNISVIEAVRNITFKPGTTRTDLGLETVKTTVFTKGHGIERRINNTMATRFVYVLTDGMSLYRQKTAAAAESLKKAVDKIASIGIGDQVSHQELMDIASDSSLVYSVNNFNSLYTVLKRLVHFDCDECENSAASDVAIFIDSSSSMTLKQYDASKNAIFHVIDVMRRLSFNDTHLSLISFSDSINTLFSMGETFSKIQIKTRVNLIDKSTTDSQILTEHVFMHARTRIFNSSATRQNAKRFLLFFTNGNHVVKDEHNLEREKSLLEAEGVNIIAVGSGDDLNLDGLYRLVTDSFNVFVTDDDKPNSNLEVLQSEFVYNKCDLKGE